MIATSVLADRGTGFGLPARSGLSAAAVAARPAAV